MADDELDHKPVPPTDDAKKLVQANYADRAVGALPDTRRFTDDLLSKLLGEFDPSAVTLRDMRRMRDDYTVKMGLHYGKAPLISADYSFVCDDPQIKAATQEAYDAIHVGLMKIALNSWDFGYQGAVKQYKYGRLETTYEDPESGEVKPVWDESSGVDPVLMGVPIPLPPEVTQPKLEKGRFDGISTPLARFTKTDDNNKHDHVPVDWSLWFVNDFEEEFRNWTGKSRLVPVYPAWYSYWANWHMRDRHAEMDADPALQIWYPPGTSGKGTANEKPNRQVAMEIGNDLRNGATVVWPSDIHYSEDGKATTTRLWEAAFLTGGENLGAFNELLDRLEVAKLRGTMVPEQALIEAQKGSGSRNVAATQTDTWLASLEMAAVYIDSIINKYYIRPFVEANWGKDAPPCKKVTTGFREEDLTLPMKLIEIAFNLDPNALPINFEAILEKLGIEMYSKKEQEERDKAIEELEAEQEEVGPLRGEPAPEPAALPGAAPAPGQLAASQEARRRKPKKYEREHLHLSSKRAPAWAHRERKRQDRNTKAVAERLREVVQARYEDMFEAAADAVADQPLELSVASTLTGLVQRVADAVKRKVAGYRGPLENEMAGMYHASGAAELLRLGMDTESWDIGRDEIQDWAREEAGSLIVTMDQTVVQQHLRPWLEKQLQAEQAGQADYGRGIPVDSVELASRLTDKFKSYPGWMAERVVRTEAMKGYNLSAADMWERVGIEEVVEFDGLGGKSGVSDEECLRRNGQTVTIDEFRLDTRNEHPNGTLGAIPVTEGVELQPLEPAVLYASAERREPTSLYAVTDDGLILSVEETGAMLAR
jgi:hypothetical protein